MKIYAVNQQEISALDGFSKVKAKNHVNQIMSRNTKGFFTDEYWKPINEIFSELNNANITYYMEKAEYQQNEKGTPIAKRWVVKIPFMNDKGKESVLYGSIVASGAGSVEDPLSRYDVVAYVS